MGDRLTETQMLQLAVNYRNHECLWKVSSELYKNREARNTAYIEICQALNIPALFPKDVPKKIKNLRSSYYQELRKMENSIRSGAGQESEYRPKVSWFSTVDGYLRPHRKRIKKNSKVNENTNTATTASDEDDSDNTSNSNPSFEESHNMASEDSREIECYPNFSHVTIKQEPSIDIASDVTLQRERNQASLSQFVAPKSNIGIRPNNTDERLFRRTMAHRKREHEQTLVFARRKHKREMEMMEELHELDLRIKNALLATTLQKNDIHKPHL